MKKFNLKKAALLSMVVISTSVLIAGCGSSTDKKAETKPTDKKKVIVVGTNATFVPFEFKNEKTQDYDGYDIDLIKAVAQKMNAKIQFKNVSFDALIPGLQAKDIDVAVSGMSITKARAEKVLFSLPYYESGQAVLTKKANENITKPADLNGKNVSAQLGTTGSTYAHSIEGAKVKEFDHSNEALLELKIGGVDAAVVDLPIAQYYVSQHPDEELKVIPADLKEKEYFGWAMNKENTALQAEINKTLADMRASGEMNKLYQKWFKQDVPADMPTK